MSRLLHLERIDLGCNEFENLVSTEYVLGIEICSHFIICVGTYYKTLPYKPLTIFIVFHVRLITPLQPPLIGNMISLKEFWADINMLSRLPVVG